MLNYKHDLEPNSCWLLVKSNQIPWGKRTNNVIPYVQELGDFYAKQEFFTQREQLPSYLLKYTVSGEGTLEYQGNTYRVRPGECFWIDCMNYQKYFTSPASDNWHVIWMHFYGNPCMHYYRLFLENNDGKPVVRLPAGSDLSMTLNNLLMLYANSDTSPFEDIQVSGQLINIMISLIMSAHNGKDEIAPDAIREAKAYMRDHYQEGLTLDALSERYNLDKYHFLRLFKRYTGSTPHEYLILTRIHQAKQLLRSTNLPIADIASQVGIDHVGHFINLFKRSEGMTPGAFRKHWGGKP